MASKKIDTTSSKPDRLGKFIGQLRAHEGITLNQLAHGLCSPAFLHRIENGEREVKKQLADILFQRLGKPAKLFERILDLKEFQNWKLRQEIIAQLYRGDIDLARTGIKTYLQDSTEVWDQQFAAMVEINCCYLSGAAPEELLSQVRDALLLTQPNFLKEPTSTLLLSRNEGRLLFAYLQLREQLEGVDAVMDQYHELFRYFKKERYERRERVYLSPAVACRIIQSEYIDGHYTSALSVCEDAIEDLTTEKSFFCYAQLLEWKQKLYDAVGNQDRMPEKLLTQLNLLYERVPKRTALLIPCEEEGNVYCLNQVIRDRRILLGISQESLAEGICNPRTISRIETLGGSLHRRKGRLLLQKVNMSGEQYDYEVISERYEDYLVRSRLGRAINAGKIEEARKLLASLQKSLPNIETNIQYMEIVEAEIQYKLPQGDPEKISLEMFCQRIETAIHHTLPLSLDNIDAWPVSSLSINECLSMIAYAFYCKWLKDFDRSLSVALYLKRCLQNTGVNISLYDDLYTRIDGLIANVLGDLGRYQESNSLSNECIMLSLEQQSVNRIVDDLYNIGWNSTQQLMDCPVTERTERQQAAISVLRQAYAMSIITGNSVMEKHIAEHSLKNYGIENLLSS